MVRDGGWGWRPILGRQLAGTVVAALLLLGCNKGAQFNGTVYRDDEVAFQVGPLPEEMRRLSSTESDLAFQNDRAGSTIAISARCGVDADDVPLRALLAHLFLQLENRKILSEEEFVLDDRAALTTELEATLDGVLRHFVVTVLKKNGCVYDFIHIDGGGEDLLLKQSRSEFRRMVKGFRTL